MEIEKKYFVKELPINLEKFTNLEIEQSYISTSPVIRLRKSNDEYFLTVKGMGQITREEFELLISKEEYEKLFKKIESLLISKTRYLIPISENLTAELDVYHGDLTSLFTVEVEFSSLLQAENFQPPKWFGEDISLRKEYKNSSLSIYGLPKNQMY